MAVNRICCGGGLELALSGDIILAAEHASFALPEIRSGTVADAASIKLPKRIPYHIAMEMLLTGRWIDTEEAARWGLINQVLPAADLVPTVEATLKALCEQPPEAMRLTKAFLRRDLEGTLWDRVSNELSDFAAGLDKDEFKEAYAAFTEKRKPVFK